MPYAGASGPSVALLPEPAPHGLGLHHDHGRSVSVTQDGTHLLRYVTHPWDPQLESPRPYVHPLRTLSGQLPPLLPLSVGCLLLAAVAVQTRAEVQAGG